MHDEHSSIRLDEEAPNIPAGDRPPVGEEKKEGSGVVIEESAFADCVNDLEVLEPAAGAGEEDDLIILDGNVPVGQVGQACGQGGDADCVE